MAIVGGACFPLRDLTGARFFPDGVEGAGIFFPPGPDIDEPDTERFPDGAIKGGLGVFDVELVETLVERVVFMVLGVPDRESEDRRERPGIRVGGY